MFDNEKAHITEIISAIFVDADKHPEKNSVFCDNTPLPRYEMIYKISGENYTYFNEKVLLTTPGCVYFLPKCEKAVYYVKRVSAGECIDIFFDTDIPLFSEAFMINVSDNKKIHPLFERFLNTWVAKKEGYYYKCMRIFYEILSELQKSTSNYLPQNKYALIEKGVDYIHLHFCDCEISYTEIAKLCGISYSYFKRLFTARFGVPPVQYVTAMKNERAKELLVTERYSVSEISEMCGFKNVYYFSRVFKKQNGISPTDYIRRNTPNSNKKL